MSAFDDALDEFEADPPDQIGPFELEDADEFGDISEVSYAAESDIPGVDVDDVGERRG